MKSEIYMGFIIILLYLLFKRRNIEYYTNYDIENKINDIENKNKLKLNKLISEDKKKAKTCISKIKYDQEYRTANSNYILGFSQGNDVKIWVDEKQNKNIEN